MVAPADAWRVIRSMRSRPPGRAADSGARRTTFQAALGQSEELWAAAQAVGPSVSPILLFYSLNQAVYALLAAHGDRVWGSAGSHGAKANYIPTGTGEHVYLHDLTVSPMGSGTLQRLARLSGTSLPSGPVSAADLVCSLPGTEHFYGRADAPRPLFVQIAVAQDHRSTHRCLAISDLPRALVRHEVGSGGRRLVLPSPEEVAEWLSRYPTLGALGEPVSIVEGVPPDLGRVGVDVPVILEWLHEDGVPELVDYNSHPLHHVDHHSWARRHIDVPLDWTSKEAAGWALPALPGVQPPLAPLLTWWLIFFTTSVAARYHPRQWTRLLRVDFSHDAVAVEAMLRLGAEEFPSLLLQAFTEGPGEGPSDAGRTKSESADAETDGEDGGPRRARATEQEAT